MTYYEVVPIKHLAHNFPPFCAKQVIKEKHTNTNYEKKMFDF